MHASILNEHFLGKTLSYVSAYHQEVIRLDMSQLLMWGFVKVFRCYGLKAAKIYWYAGPAVQKH